MAAGGGDQVAPWHFLYLRPLPQGMGRCGRPGFSRRTGSRMAPRGIGRQGDGAAGGRCPASRRSRGPCRRSGPAGKRGAGRRMRWRRGRRMSVFDVGWVGEVSVHQAGGEPFVDGRRCSMAPRSARQTTRKSRQFEMSALASWLPRRNFGGGRRNRRGSRLPPRAAGRGARRRRG